MWIRLKSGYLDKIDLRKTYDKEYYKRMKKNDFIEKETKRKPKEEKCWKEN